MAAFSFRLQPVLNLRLQTEENLKNELGKAIQLLELEKQKLSGLETEMNELVDVFNKKTKKTTVRKLIEVKEYLSLLDSKIKRQKENVNSAMLNVDKIREELLKAVKERKILEKLRERKLEEYQLEQKKLEQKTNDEIVSYNHKDG